MKLIRSFFGAFLGAALAIWPAATWNEPWLLLFGGALGWLLGYQGDRLVGSLIRGWQHARRVGFQAYLVAAAKRSAFMNWTIRSVRGIENGFSYLFRLMQSIGSIEVPFGHWFVGTAKWGVVVFNSSLTFPRRSADWFAAHPVNRAAVLRFIAGLSSTILFIVVMWLFIGTHLVSEVGSTITGTNGQPVIVTESYWFWNTFMTTVLFGFAPSVISMVMLQDERCSMRGFYRIWERYTARGPVLFTLGEAVRFLWIEVWITWTVISGIVSAMVTTVVVMFGVMLAWSGVVLGLKLAWRAVRLNRDYGVVSLGIALLVGTITFYVYRDDLVADAWFRLGVSLVAGFVAGASSFLVTGLCGLMFLRSITVRRIAVRKGFKSSEELQEWFIDVLPTWWWQQNKRLLPALG